MMWPSPSITLVALRVVAVAAMTVLPSRSSTGASRRRLRGAALAAVHRPPYPGWHHPIGARRRQGGGAARRAIASSLVKWALGGRPGHTGGLSGAAAPREVADGPDPMDEYRRPLCRVD